MSAVLSFAPMPMRRCLAILAALVGIVLVATQVDECDDGGIEEYPRPMTGVVVVHG